MEGKCLHSRFFIAAMAIVVAPITWLMFRAHRADQRKIERIREDWESGGREEPGRGTCFAAAATAAQDHDRHCSDAMFGKSRLSSTASTAALTNRMSKMRRGCGGRSVLTA